MGSRKPEDDSHTLWQGIEVESVKQGEPLTTLIFNTFVAGIGLLCFLLVIKKTIFGGY